MRGFTLLELLIAIGIILLLAGLLLPALRHARESAKRTQCLNNMRQIYVAFMVYADENNGVLPPFYGTDAPPTQHWMVRLQPSGLSTKIIFCPSDPNYTPNSSPLDPDDRKSHSYVLNAFPELVSAPGSTPSYWDISNPSEVILLTEKKASETDYYLSMPSEDPLRVLEEKRHNGASNYLFIDGHVRSLIEGRSRAPHNLWSLNPAD